METKPASVRELFSTWPVAGFVILLICHFDFGKLVNNHRNILAFKTDQRQAEIQSSFKFLKLFLEAIQEQLVCLLYYLGRCWGFLQLSECF